MTRKLLVFGNGLGMALDQEHFSLPTALEHVWNRPAFLRSEQKRLIERCLQRSGAPQGEHELDTLHQAVTYCKALSQIGEGNVHWLTEDGIEFPRITATYIHKVATKLHNFDGRLPSHFEQNLIQFVKETRSHIATLNYDKLLYTAFVDSDVLDGYSGSLVDGMLAQGFCSDALERRYGKTFGYYLHLHGSPLFVNRGASVVKLARHQLTLDTDEASEHLVLTHIKRKPSVIAASLVLSSYWDYLGFALSEAEEVILFGYSGLDDHLNVLLRPYLGCKALRVVEWNGSGDQDDREVFWKSALGQSVSVTRLENITEFSDW